MTPEEYRQAQADIATRSQQVALAVAATSPLAGFSLASQLGTFLASMNLTATLLADVYVAAALAVEPLGLTTPSNEADRLTAVMAGVIEDSGADPLPRIGRIAQSEPSATAREATATAVEAHDQAEVRLQWVLDPDPCPQCTDLASRTYAPEEVPESHPFCECTLAPVIEKKETAA